MRNILFLLALLYPVFSFPQDDYIDDRTKLHYIVSIKKGMDSLRDQIAGKEADLSKEKTEKGKLAIEDEIVELSARLKRAENSFDAIVSGISYTDDDTSKERKTLVQDLEDILTPIIQNFKRMSEKPRRIERLKGEVMRLEEKITVLSDGEENIDQIIAAQNESGTGISDELNNSKLRLSIVKDSLKLRLNIVQSQLSELEKENKSFWRTSAESMKDFIKTKGLNLLIALVAAVLSFGMLFALKRIILRPLFGKQKLASFGRPIIALYEVVAVVLSSIAGLISLLVMNDWFLFTLFIIIIGALIWSFKHLVLELADTVRIVMDMGTVREGQRIMLNGIPWLVRKIGIRTSLINQALQGGHINISMNKLKEFTSRHVVEEEPWFPTAKNDFVILSDGTYGKVLVQTPEQVVLMLDRVTRKFYSTTDFLNMRPQNLSDGFVLTIPVSIGYGHQKKIFQIAELIQKELQEKLRREDAAVEFSEPGIDSLNLVAIVPYDGGMAWNYLLLRRRLQQALVEICVKHKLDIPFRQLTVHSGR